MPQTREVKKVLIVSICSSKIRLAALYSLEEDYGIKCLY
jgi:hypothetical protein